MAVRKTKAGLALKRWFKEDWKDVRTGKACGRKKGEKRGTPYCRPSNVARKKRDPKVGTGKKPKGSGRRLYTDENPKDTVKIKFATPSDARATVAKVKKINKPYARKIQILTVGEQRAKVMGKTQVASIFKKGKEAIRKKRGTKTG